ncbi:MAG: hypothetical protein ACHQ49_00645 [Elusimicrobiota bacterium]
MEWKKVGTWILRAGLTFYILILTWFVPPAVHKALHYCPVRPDGLAQADALPSFARKYKMSCSQCHSGFPVLNAYGRQFKMNGFVREQGGTDGVLESQDKSLTTEVIMPWAAVIRSRPIDDGKGGVASQGSQMGATASPNPNGFQFQPLNDVDAFIAGGNAARHISYFGELDANQAGGFAPSMGDIRLGYHPFAYLNVVAARRNFFADDPYQTIASNESPTIANRATDLLMQGQGSISGNAMLTMQQSLSVNGQADLHGDSFLYYAVGATKDSDGGYQANSPTNASGRLAFDSGSGLMLGAFGTFGEERAVSQGAGAIGGNLGVDAGLGEVQHFQRGGFDALYELGGFAARGAFVYSQDYDKLLSVSDTNRAAYAELAYYYKRAELYPFLVPLVRENWYTTYNGSQQFNYLTAQVAHYFAPNLKGLLEYSVDTKTGEQGGTLADPGLGGTLAQVQRGNRTTLQFEVGF